MEKYPSLGAVLAALKERAGLSGTELARRIGKSRYTLSRWQKEGARLSEEDIVRLRTALRYVEEGAIKELSEQEVMQLRIHGRCLPPETEQETRPVSDRSAIVDQCIVYSATYAPHTFPTRWSKRQIEVEREIAGNICFLADYLAPVTRPADFYEHSSHRDFFDRDLVDIYSAEWQEYLDFFSRERLDDVVIQHLYERRGLEAYLLGQAADWRDRAIPVQIRSQQLQTLLTWIEDGRIEVGITNHTVPACFKIVGHETVLVEFTQGSHFLKRGNLLGLEIRGTSAVQQFKDQFDSIWKSRETERDHIRVSRELQRLLALLSTT